MRKIISIILSFGLLFQQSGLLYAAGELNLANYLSQARNAIVRPDVFQPARLRYISYDIAGNDFKILLDKGDSFNQKTEKPKNLKTLESLNFPIPKLLNSQTPELNESTQELFNYFLIGLALPNDTFWVNLRPDAQENIIDPLLEKTDIGKIFLEADLQLKKDTASLTSPQNPEGKQYWDKLYKKAGELFGTENITIPTITRPWIVPNEVIVRETEDSAYIYKATLKVMLEADYLADQKTEKQKNQKTDGYSFSDPRLKEMNEYSSQLIRETIIPKLTKEINSSKRYAKLRQVYYSLVLSRWFKQKYSSPGSISASERQSPGASANSYISLIDSGNLVNLASKESYDKHTYFQAYQNSFKNGEYNLKETVATPFGRSIRSYISGGISVGSPIMSGNLKVQAENKKVMGALTESSDLPLSNSKMYEPEKTKRLKAIKKEAISIIKRMLAQEGGNPRDLMNFQLTIFSKMPDEYKDIGAGDKNLDLVMAAIEEYYIKRIANSQIERESLLEVLKEIIKPFEDIVGGEWYSSVESVRKAKEIVSLYNKLIEELKGAASPLEAKELKKHMDEIRSYLGNANNGIYKVFFSIDEFHKKETVNRLSSIVRLIDKNIVSITKGEFSNDKLLSYISDLRNGLNEIVTKCLPLSLKGVSNVPERIVAAEISRNISNAAVKAEELYNKLSKQMFVALVDETSGSPLSITDIKKEAKSALSQAGPNLKQHIKDYEGHDMSPEAIDMLPEETPEAVSQWLNKTINALKAILKDKPSYYNPNTGFEVNQIMPVFEGLIKKINDAQGSMGGQVDILQGSAGSPVGVELPLVDHNGRSLRYISFWDVSEESRAEFINYSDKIIPNFIKPTDQNVRFIIAVDANGQFSYLVGVVEFNEDTKLLDKPPYLLSVLPKDLKKDINFFLKGRSGENPMKNLDSAVVVGSPVLGEELVVPDKYDIRYKRNIPNLRSVLYDELEKEQQKIIQKLLREMVFKGKTVVRDGDYEQEEIPSYLASYTVPADENMLKGAFIAIEAQGGNIKSIEAIMIKEGLGGKEVFEVYSKKNLLLSDVPFALMSAWEKKYSQEIVSSSIEKQVGGIDLTDRALHIKLERVGSFASTPLLLPQVKNAQGLDLDKEFKQLEALASSGIVPNSHRLLELFTVCHYRGEFGERLNQIISCLKAASAIQEAQAIDSDEDFRLALMMPEVLS